ncbi:TRAP transporter small permease, partial [Propionivibrio dicarboxylicus]
MSMAPSSPSMAAGWAAKATPAERTGRGIKMFSRLLLKSLEWLLICIFGLMVLLVFGNVVLRYGFNYGIIFSEEVSRFLFVWMVFLG